MFITCHGMVLCSCGIMDAWQGFLKLLPEIGDGEDDDSEAFEVGVVNRCVCYDPLLTSCFVQNV